MLQDHPGMVGAFIRTCGPGVQQAYRSDRELCRGGTNLQLAASNCQRLQKNPDGLLTALTGGCVILVADKAIGIRPAFSAAFS